MKIEYAYGTPGALDLLKTSKGGEWRDIESAVSRLSLSDCRTKLSKEKTSFGQTLISAPALNDGLKENFHLLGWAPWRGERYVCNDGDLLLRIVDLPANLQREAIIAAGQDPEPSFVAIDFIRNAVAVEVQLGKYPFVEWDFKKGLFLSTRRKVEVVCVIVPSSRIRSQMPTGSAKFGTALANLVLGIRYNACGPVPLVLLGIDD